MCSGQHKFKVPKVSVECGTAVSKNPFLSFSVKGAKAGDKIGVVWRDSRGVSRTDEALVL